MGTHVQSTGLHDATTAECHAIDWGFTYVVVAQTRQTAVPSQMGGDKCYVIAESGERVARGPKTPKVRVGPTSNTTVQQRHTETT
jgi:hypothetical protein